MGLESFHEDLGDRENAERRERERGGGQERRYKKREAKRRKIVREEGTAHSRYWRI